MGDKISSETVVGRHEILGLPVEVVRLTWRDDPGLSFDVVRTDTGECLTGESFDEYPDTEQMREVVRNASPTYRCLRCAQLTGPGYHIVGVAPPGTYCCDDCWDERLR